MKRDRAIPGWYCACGNPNGFEAAVFSARGLVPTPLTEARKRMIRMAGFPILFGHDDKGAGVLWVHSGLDTLMRSGALIGTRLAACYALSRLEHSRAVEALVTLDAALRIAPHVPDITLADELGITPESFQQATVAETKLRESIPAWNPVRKIRR